MDPFERNRIGNGHPTVFRLVARLVSQKMIFGSHDHTTTSVMILCQQSVLVTLWTKPVYVANIWRTNPSMEKVNQHSCTHGTQIRSTHPPPEFVCKSIDRTTKWSLKMGIFALFKFFFNPVCIFYKSIDRTTKWNLKMEIFARFQLSFFNPICVFCSVLL